MPLTISKGAELTTVVDREMVSDMSDGNASLLSERDRVEYDSLPEFVREPRSQSRETYAAAPKSSEVSVPSYVSKYAYVEEEEGLPKTAELEALWPGVNHDFLHVPKRGPSFYLTLGFLAGSVVSLLVVWGFSMVVHLATAPRAEKKIVLQQGRQDIGARQSVATFAGAPTPVGNATVTTRIPSSGSLDVIVPLNQVYEVGNGDTLAGIAFKNYRRATPRLLDAICQANGMKNPNMLSLGQKLNLPDYRPQAMQTPGGN